MQKWNTNRKHSKVQEQQLVSTSARAPVTAALQRCQYLFSNRGYKITIFGDNIPKAQEKTHNYKEHAKLRWRDWGVADADGRRRDEERSAREEKKTRRTDWLTARST